MLSIIIGTYNDASSIRMSRTRTHLLHSGLVKRTLGRRYHSNFAVLKDTLEERNTAADMRMSRHAARDQRGQPYGVVIVVLFRARDIIML